MPRASRGEVHHHHQGAQNIYANPSRDTAEQKAKEFGWEGMHAMGSFWMPYREYPEN